MANAILIIGDSGSGKTTSLFPSKKLGHKGLNPKETFIISTEKPDLPVRGAEKFYPKCDVRNKESFKTKNFLYTDKTSVMLTVVKFVIANRPEIKNLVIDDAGFVIANETFRRSGETGFQKFTDTAKMMKDLVDILTKGLRDDMVGVMIVHPEEFVDNATGEVKVRAKQFGKMFANLNNSLEASFTTVLYSKVEMNEDTEQLEGKFITNSGDENTCKSPHGMFDLEIKNDLGFVINTILEFGTSDNDDFADFE